VVKNGSKIRPAIADGMPGRHRNLDEHRSVGDAMMRT
jgi:hypothetical protein